MTPLKEDRLRYLTVLLATLALVPVARSGTWIARPTGRAQPARIAAISQQVFGPRWRVAACIAHYESTDGAHLYNGPNLGPWQINVAAHPWVDRGRVVSDWLYSARVAWRISSHGTDWQPWSTHRNCGV